MGLWSSEAAKWIALFVWVGIQCGLFGYYFYNFYTEKRFYYARMYLRYGLLFARPAAACLNFNCMLILLPVCRNLLSLFRHLFTKCGLKAIARVLDKNISFHKLCAYAICFWTAIHTVAHCYNVEFFVTAQAPRPSTLTNRNTTVFELSSLGATTCPRTGDGWVNAVCTSNSPSIYEVVKMFPAISGVILTMCLIIIVLSATEFIRRSYFEIFWFTHHTFVVFFAFLVVHGLNGVVRSQEATSLEVHDPVNCSETDFATWNTTGKCPLPKFISNTPSTWYWVLGPIILYVIECLIRFYRSVEKVVITKVVKHPSRVIELQMKKKGFKMDAGQYIFLKCPALSKLEWHPFTLTSSPEEEYFSVHIRIAGDWTEALAKLLKTDEADFQESWQLPKVYVDGPFGTASEDWDAYKVDVLVGAGIGITPFASIMKHMWYSYLKARDSSRLQKVYLYWICPDTQAFEWFSDLLHHLEEQMKENGCPDFLTHSIYLTRGWDTNFARNIALHEEEETDVVTGLKQKTHYGRPNWDLEFKKLAESNPSTEIGVFFCGPKILSTELNKMCKKYSGDATQKAHFIFNKENF